jgi:DNA replication factor GINS
MDIKTLREALRREKMSPYLQELGRDFYREAQKLFERMLEDYKAAKDSDLTQLSLKLAELENLKNMINDLYETRERKIVSSALYYVKSGEEVEFDNLTEEEEALLREIIRVIKASREKVLTGFVKGRTGERVEERREEGRKEIREEKRGEIPFITVRILKDLPSLVGVDGKIYGDFKAEDVVTLPEPNAKILVKRGDAELISVGDS